MAEKVKTFAKRYPWELWTDGSKWRAKRGVDFKPPVEGFAATLYSRARRDDMHVTVAIIDRKTVEWQFAKSK